MSCSDADPGERNHTHFCQFIYKFLKVEQKGNIALGNNFQPTYLHSIHIASLGRSPFRLWSYTLLLPLAQPNHTTSPLTR